MEKNLSNYHRTQMKKELVLQSLKDRGCRITKQRQILLDIILQEECGSCKEIYYKSMQLDDRIGAATVYRMVNLLEEIGEKKKKNMYRISCSMNCEKENACMVELDDNTVCKLSAQDWYQVISEGLRRCGYVEGQKVISVTVAPCTYER